MIEQTVSSTREGILITDKTADKDLSSVVELQTEHDGEFSLNSTMLAGLVWIVLLGISVFFWGGLLFFLINLYDFNNTSLKYFIIFYMNIFDHQTKSERKFSSLDKRL